MITQVTWPAVFHHSPCPSPAEVLRRGPVSDQRIRASIRARIFNTLIDWRARSLWVSPKEWLAAGGSDPGRILEKAPGLVTVAYPRARSGSPLSLRCPKYG